MSKTVFKDHFSNQSDLYVKHRPHYPLELYAFLSSLTEKHDRAWDCGTGNGQAAIGLALYYNKVIATDPSQQQINNSFHHEKVQYLVEKAEYNSIESGSIDIVTIANALHWFDFDLFYKEVNRVVKENGVVAAWAYELPTICAEIDKLVHEYHYETLGKYWLPENWLVVEKYETIPFPFQQIDCPHFSSDKHLKRSDFIGFLNTWSATQRFIKENKYNPTDALSDALKEFWDDDCEKLVRWKLVVKIGRVGGVGG